MSEQTDSALVRRANRGNREAFAALLDRHYDRIYRFSFRVLGDAEEAADLAQDVCVSLPRKLTSFRGKSPFTTWLYRVVINAGRDALRRKGTRRRNEQIYMELDAQEHEDRAGRQRQLAWLQEALGQLSEELRATAALVTEEGLRHGEVGKILGVSESTVSWRMHRVRKHLRALAINQEEIT